MTVDPTAAAEAGFSIDSIKEIMDGFDPAAILPDIGTIVGKIELVCRIAILIGPLLLLALGLAYLFLAPKEANYYFGYRTFFGMGSVPAWRYTQKIAGLVLGVSGAVLTLAMLIAGISFGGMAAMDMVWKAVRCLIWQAVIALLGTVLINSMVGAAYDSRGERRKKTR